MQRLGLSGVVFTNAQIKFPFYSDENFFVNEKQRRDKSMQCIKFCREKIGEISEISSKFHNTGQLHAYHFFRIAPLTTAYVL